MMEFDKLITDRYSVRKFLPEHLNQDDIDKILEAGHIAPTGCNYQPQRILVLNTDESINKLKNCTKCHFNAPTAMPIDMHYKKRPIDDVVRYESFKQATSIGLFSM